MFIETYDYKYSDLRYFILRNEWNYDDINNLIYIKGGISYEQRDTYIELDELLPGLYYIYVKIDWKNTTTLQNRIYSINSYAP
jgi:hypothetical protein